MPALYIDLVPNLLDINPERLLDRLTNGLAKEGFDKTVTTTFSWAELYARRFHCADNLCRCEHSTAIVPARFLAFQGTLPISVHDLANGLGSNQFFLTLVPQPQIVAATPQEVSAGSPSLTMTVVGSQFQPAYTVQVGNTAVPATYVNGNGKMKPQPAPHVPGETQAERFNNAVLKLFSVSKEDFLKEEVKYQRKQARKRRAKKATL